MDLYSDYSFIKDDIGYKIRKTNQMIALKFPYKNDIDPRLVKFLRELYYFNKNGIMPCVPLYNEYSISKSDWYCIHNYLVKYNISMKW